MSTSVMSIPNEDDLNDGVSSYDRVASESPNSNANENTSRDITENTVHIHKRKPQSGIRYLKEGDDVYRYNVWDHVEWDFDQLQAAREIINRQLESKMSSLKFEEIEEKSDKNWDEFYRTHDDKFYKDRQWLFTEFPELNFDDKAGSDESKVIFEVGCGVGNSVFPILQKNSDTNLHVYCCDFSGNAINILKKDEKFTERCTAFVLDITKDEWNLPLSPNSVNLILMVYVLSAIRPDKMHSVLMKLSQYLKPDGMVLFRDYGRYDLSQLRFKGSRCVSENFYVRGEGTFAYFFDKDEVAEMFTRCGYEIKQLQFPTQLQVNRKRQIKMYRVWIQGKFTKSASSQEGNNSISRNVSSG